MKILDSAPSINGKSSAMNGLINLAVLLKLRISVCHQPRNALETDSRAFRLVKKHPDES